MRRIAGVQVETALERLDELSSSPDEAVHEIRKHCKKLRGLVRLVRDAVRPDEYRTVNGRLRDTARMFSDARDARIRVDVFQRLLDEEPPPLEFPDAFEEVRELLDRAHRIEVDRVASTGVLRASAELAFQESGERIGAWQLPEEPVPFLQTGLRRIYRRGQRRLLEIQDGGRPERFHEWRKRVKYLWYATRILQPAWPRAFETYAEALHDVSEWLGEGNDLTRFVSTRGIRDGNWQRRAGPLLQEMASDRRARLWARAIDLGRRIYAEPPEAFARRIGAYTEVWQTTVGERRGP